MGSVFLIIYGKTYRNKGKLTQFVIAGLPWGDWASFPRFILFHKFPTSHQFRSHPTSVLKQRPHAAWLLLLPSALSQNPTCRQLFEAGGRRLTWSRGVFFSWCLLETCKMLFFWALLHTTKLCLHLWIRRLCMQYFAPKWFPCACSNCHLIYLLFFLSLSYKPAN